MNTLIKLLLAAFAVLPVQAATYTVTTNADAGSGSLRQAILDANANAGPDIINFAPALNGQKILLTSGQLTVTNSVSILGPGPNQLAIEGSYIRVFYLNAGQSNFIAGLTITNGYASRSGPFDPEEAGGGIQNDRASLTVSNVTFSGNRADDGGAIANLADSGSATLMLQNCTLSGNFGGAIYNYGNATLTLQNCNLSGNSGDDGGAIHNSGTNGNATLTLQNCTLGGNSAYGYGGAIYNFGTNGNATLTLQNCTLSGNSAYFGGAIYNYGYGGNATLTLQNCTLSGNSARGGGGGIYSAASSFPSGGAAVTLQYCTFSGNSYSGDGGDGGGGIELVGSTLTITHTLLAHGSGPNFVTSFGGATVSNLSYNLSDDSSTTNFATTVPNLFLGPLANNGGPTLTHALLPCSPAFNAGDTNFTGPPAYDQRGPGFPRVLFGRIDIGAFELPSLALAVTVVSTNDSGPGTLRQALNDACSGSTITFDPALNGKTITLTNGQLAVTKNVSIVGPGPGQLTVRRSSVGGTPAFRLLAVNTGVTATVSGLTLSNGNSADGGGLRNDGTLTVSNCVIAGNSSSGNGGGAIYVGTFGTLTVADCTLSNNTSTAGGGAIAQASGGGTTLNRCTFSGNSAVNGGALFNQAFNQNGLPPIFIPALLYVTNCTFSGNTATDTGSAAYNVANNGQATAYLAMQHCTVSGNIGNFALVSVANSASSLLLVGGCVVGNNGGGIPDAIGAGAPVISLGYNLVSRADGFATATGDRTGTVASPLDPLLGPLANNGGPTLTHLLLSGSPALDAGNTNTSGFPATDQRGPGFPRILNGRINIGAVENQPPPPPSVLINPVWFSVSNTFQFSFTNVAGASFTVLASTNVALPLSNWTVVGIASEPSSGQYQFVDTQGTNAPRKFYSVRWQ